MKNKDVTKNFRTRFILNIIVSAFIVCVAEGLLAVNFGRLIGLFTGISTEEETVSFGIAEVLIFVILGILLFAVVFFLLEKPSIDYIREISEGVEDIAAGDLARKIPVKGDDEFSQMAESVNRMAVDLEKLLIFEREAEQQKTDLITNIAHDLRTPLTSVIGYLELLSGKTYDSLSDSQRRKYLKIAFNKSKRLEQLISDLFDFTKLSYGKVTMKMEYIDVVKLLGQLLEEAYPLLNDNGMTYELRTNTDSQEITGDATLIARLFDNLIGNAIKYGKDGKKILVRVHTDEPSDTVTVKVTNYGFVIDEKDLPHIFEKFYRADRARSTETGGTGLGLAIVKNIAEMHNGSVSVESDLRGTTFTVRLRIHFNKNHENLRRA